MTVLGESGSRPPSLGRYELITRIGQGGMAEVQLALQRGPAGFEKLVVVKLVHENLASQKAFVDMLLDEARNAALVKHPNVVDIYDLGEVDGRYFIAMEYLEGEPLLAVLRAGRDGQRLDALSTARLIADTAEGLDAAHELRSLAGDPIELVHHDVSLGNIVVLYNGRVKLVDFGVAKASQSAGTSTRVQGKFGYMAPEKLRGNTGDRRSDLWSLGCVLWEALTLTRLFKGATDSDTMQQVLESNIHAPSQINGDVPADFDPIVLRALERDPAQRYASAKAMAADLEEVLRKHGYAAKNDAIATYMQATFATHIAARKQLLQQVSSKGRASPDVVEAAFHDREIATGTPLVHARDSGVMRGPAGSSPSLRFLTASSPALRPPPADDDGHGFNDPPTPPPRIPVTPLNGGDGPTRVERAPVIARMRHHYAIAAGAAGAAAGVVIALVVVVGGSDVAPNAAPRAHSEPAPMVVAAPPPPESPHVAAPPPPSTEPAPGEPPPPPPPPSTEPAPGTTTRRAPAPSESPAPRTAGPAPHAANPRGAPPRITALPNTDAPKIAALPVEAPPKIAALAADKPSAAELSKLALQAWARGDGKTAIALYKRALQVTPTHAAAWRGLGLVYEKQGDRTAARAAYQRYLQLQPSAPDAAGIRARLSPP